MGIAPGGGKLPFPTRDDANRTVRTGGGAAPTKGGEEAEKALRGAHQACLAVDRQRPVLAAFVKEPVEFSDAQIEADQLGVIGEYGVQALVVGHACEGLAELGQLDAKTLHSGHRRLRFGRRP
jgi:hypothetical protein